MALVFKVGQEIRNHGIINWSDDEKIKYWVETLKKCEERNIEGDLISKARSIGFKLEVGSSHIFTHALDIPFGEACDYYDAVRAGIAHIIRREHPEVFSVDTYA